MLLESAIIDKQLMANFLFGTTIVSAMIDILLADNEIRENDRRDQRRMKKNGLKEIDEQIKKN